ncbi:flagellar biosynthetic protein FliP [Shewanella hanedai]|uniref:Flagellar biosynthetic protein FliP n=1 Tax=Shewanella hanedai TaxID=25 RepID=A0A553JV01_SHEHA|nr:flagellar type III secretion system pore protein FliP [Shewanella hanedai]TRY16278.1 flagellar type III secretion system pore protein FliP [Shewanella hanedai]GGI67662.1 flagellar biosynthetic protein FliP [Shewanella hanedai]
MVATQSLNEWLPHILDKPWLDSLAPELRVILTVSSLTLIPVIVISMTAFTRIIIVLSLLRQALGLQQTPPNSVLIALSLFLTVFAMSGVFEQINKNSFVPYTNNSIELSAAVNNAIEPLKSFMLSQTDETHFVRVLDMANVAAPKSRDDVSLIHLVPAFMLSELTLAFKMAFLIFLPFLMIDLLVASSLMALGMIMVPPITVSLPLKIMVFILIDGWTLIAGSLVQSFL